MLYVGRTVCGLKLLELARAVGMREYATVSMAVKRYAGHLRVDARAQKELRRVMKMLKLSLRCDPKGPARHSAGQERIYSRAPKGPNVEQTEGRRQPESAGSESGVR